MEKKLATITRIIYVEPRVALTIVYKINEKKKYIYNIYIKKKKEEGASIFVSTRASLYNSLAKKRPLSSAARTARKGYITGPLWSLVVFFFKRARYIETAVVARLHVTDFYFVLSWKWRTREGKREAAEVLRC